MSASQEGSPRGTMTDEANEIRGLTLEKWHEEALAGHRVPLHIPVNGVSMYPLIRRNRDYVTIFPVDRSPVAGDIVLFSDPQRRRYVLHRVREVRDGYVITRGDNCNAADAPVPAENVWGRAVLIERGKLTIHPHPGRGLAWAGLWQGVRKCRSLLSAVKRKLKVLTGSAGRG